MRTLSEEEVLELHRRIVEQSGGALGVRDRGALQSAVAQPDMGVGDERLYPSVVEAACAVAHGIALGHPFVDGNKRVAHAALEVTLVMNGLEFEAPVGELEAVFVDLAAGRLSRADFTARVEKVVHPSR